MEDLIVEPVRQSLIPKFEAVKTASLAAGALGGGISGAGPSIFMLCKTRRIAEEVENAMQMIYSETDIDFNTYVSEVSTSGVRFL